jgi:hypothetical protein
LKKKLLVIAIALILTIVVPIVVAQIVNNQVIHISGSANYPRNNATPTPSAATPTATPSSSANVAFSLWFPNGTKCPASLTNLPCNVYGPLDSVGGIPATTQLVVRNDGNVPINIAVTATNIAVPSNIQFTLGTTGTSNSIAAGASANIYIAINMVTTNTNFQANTPFSYNFDVNLAATQA